MTDRLHIADTDLALYAMGALTAEETNAVRSHLQVCALCTEELHQNTLALAAYAQTTPEIAPPEGARERFLAKLVDTPQLAALPQTQPLPIAAVLPEEPVSLWRAMTAFVSANFAGPLAGALAILLIGIAIDDLRYREALHNLRIDAKSTAADSAQLAQLIELLSSTHVQRVALHPAPIASPPPEGRVVYEASSGKLLMTASNLHPLPAGKTYELWILQPGGKKPLPAGTFAPDNFGNASVILAQAPAGLTVQGFGVTIENAGGSDTPTLPIVLSGS